MRLVIVTGMSGAGRNTALKMLEDMGFYCADNLPVELLDKFADLMLESSRDFGEAAAIGVDIRSGEQLPLLAETLDKWTATKVPYTVLYMECSDEVLTRRYKESRRAHPLAPNERVGGGIRLERERLQFIKKRANYVLDTSNLLTRDLRSELARIFVEREEFSNLFVTVLSFGFKYGIPADADLVFDVRFLPNPYYVPELRHRTGDEEDVQNYVRQGGVADTFMEKLSGMVTYLLPYYQKEGKSQLVIAIGCTGGRHRSVTIANLLYEKLKNHEGIGLKVMHRDIDRG